MAKEGKPDRLRLTPDQGAVTAKQLAELVEMSKKVRELSEVAWEEETTTFTDEDATVYRYLELIQDLLNWYSTRELAEKTGMHHEAIVLADIAGRTWLRGDADE